MQHPPPPQPFQWRRAEPPGSAGRKLGWRKRKSLDFLWQHAPELIQESFIEMGWDPAAAADQAFEALDVTRAEITCLRLYSGPMAMLYNAVLRAMATGGFVQGGRSGQAANGRFVTTIHAISSGVTKLSQLQPCCSIYRGNSGVLLPGSFRRANALNIRGGVEHGFSSATVDLKVAKHSSAVGRETDEVCTIFEMRTGMVNRGAFIGWLSQFPKDLEVLIPPMTSLEVLNNRTEADGTRVFSMALTCSLDYKTMEDVFASRKLQCSSLAQVVRAGVAMDLAAAPHDQWLQNRLVETDTATASVNAVSADRLNQNQRFTDTVAGLMELVPKAFRSSATVHESSPITSAAFDPDGTWLATGTMVHRSRTCDLPGVGGIVQLWDLRSDEYTKIELRGHSNDIRAVAWDYAGG